MLAASDPQLFIPFGRTQIERHIGSSVIPVPQVSCSSDTSLEQDCDELSISAEEDPNETWIVRENNDSIEEELYVKHRAVIWSRGNFGVSLENFGEEQPGGRLLVRSYTSKCAVKQALWCSFVDDCYSPQLSESAENNTEGVCILDDKQLNIYMSGSEEYFTRLPFKISRMWETQYGLLIERAVQPLNTTNLSLPPFANLNSVPTLFALTHPLNEMSPFLILKPGNILSFMKERYMKVIWVSKNPSICMIYDFENGVHSLWKIRKTTEEELKLMNMNSDTEDPSCSVMNTNTDSEQPSSSVLTNSSMPFSFQNRSSVSINHSVFSSPFNSQLNASHASSTIYKFQSPVPRIAGRSGSFSTASPNVSNRKFSHITGSPRYSDSPKNSPSVDARLGGNLSMPPNQVPMPVQAELCLESIWTEISGNKKDGESGPASSLFISCDFVGQKHLCYLIPSKHQLHCARLGETNERELIVGPVTVIAAKDAVYSPNVNVIVVLERSGQVSLYSGTFQVGQVIFGSVSSSQYLTSSYRIVQCTAPFITSSRPSRSSLLSSTTTGEDFFDEHFQQISPVKKHVFDDKYNSLNESAPSSSLGGLQSIPNSIGSRATFKCSDGSYYRVNFPTLSTSLLVKECLKVFRIILPKDVALNFMITWYRSRNAPGTQDISSEQEWKLFLEVLLRCLGYDVNTVPLIQTLHGKQNEVPNLPKKKRESNLGSESDWKYLLESAYHRENFHRVSNFVTLKKHDYVDGAESKSSYEICSTALLYQHFYTVFISLHLLYEDFRLNSMRYNSLAVLVKLLNQLAVDLNLENFLHYYWRNHPQIINRPLPVNLKNIKYRGRDCLPDFIDNPPDIFELAFGVMKKEQIQPYPFIHNVNNTSHDILQLFSLIFNPECAQYDDIVKCISLPGNKNSTSETLISQYYSLPDDYRNIERVVSLMAKAGLNQNKLQTLPVGLAWPLMDILHRCRECPREDWSAAEYDLLVREDLSSQVKQKKNDDAYSFKSITPKSPAGGEEKTTDTYDGMEDMDDDVMKLIWPKDRRVHQIRQMLQSSTPAIIDLQQRPDVNHQEFVEEQERHLFSICTRTMALPAGRGMFTLHTMTPSITEPLNIPKLCLVGKSASQGTSIDFSHIEVVANMNLWPLFHNGVAAGLRVSPKATVDSTWILFNKPKSGTEMLPEHAGFLMALGLNGHLKNLKRMNMYEYLSRHHEMTNVALLIGLSATYRGTMNTATTKLLSLHIECLLPPTSLELDIDQNTQIAALLGIGLVYQKSAHRHMAEVLLAEMGRPPGPEMENCIDRESYTLAAGLALGLVLLEKGNDLSGLTDLGIPDTLHYFMVGGHKRPLSGPQKEKYKSPSYQIREGDIVNVDVTSPGATLALGLMFFNTGNKTVADWMKAPDTQYILDIICPDFILLRTLAKGLIMWDDILPTVEWVESHIPETIRPYCLVKPKGDQVPTNIDLETMNQAFCNIVAGACFAVGLRFAGSANNTAFETVHYFCKIFITLFGKSISELAGKSTIENCLNVSLISLSLIMAGTGNVEVLRICRCLRSRVCHASNTVVTYGSHLATHMALGLLFFGGGRYSLSTSPESIAALIIAFYPKFPTHSNDNRYHLQAFRHLYVLATESRLLLPRDIDSEQPVYANVNMHFIDTKYYQNQEVKLMAPCLLPELKYLKKIEIKDERYWPVVFKREKNWNQLEYILQNSMYINIKQRSGFLPYKEDKDGYCILAASPCTTDDCVPWSPDIECMRKYTSDPCILKIMDNFFDQYSDSTVSVDEIQFNNLFKRVVHECVTQDKLYMLSFWISMIKILQKIKKFPNAYYSWQIKLFCRSVLYTDHVSKLPSPSRPLTAFELGIAVQHYLFRTLESWEKKYCLNLQSCFKETDATEKYRSRIEEIKATILSVYDVPVSFHLNSELKDVNPLELFSCLRGVLSTSAVKKLCESRNC